MNPTTAASGLIWGRRLLFGVVSTAAALWWLERYGAAALLEAGAVVTVVASVCYLVWHADPAWTLSLGVLLAPIASHWPELHVSGVLSPDRLLLIAGVGVVVLHGPAVAIRPPLRPRPVHWVLVIASLYAIGSAAASRTLFDKDAFFRLLEAYGVLLFAVFYVAPAAFSDARRRRILLATLIALGAYLGLTALFEATHLNGLVWPRYINDPSVGIHFGRARGPFVEAVQNGVGLYACGIAAAVGAAMFTRRRVRWLCLGVVILDAAGILFTLQRSVWISAVTATALSFVVFRDLRRFLLPVLVGGALVGGAAYAVVGSDAVRVRATDQATVWDRYNLDHAALNMIAARPLFGSGWATFPVQSVSGEFFQQSASYPLTATGVEVHNEFLSHGAELGLVGATLWLAGLGLAALAVLRTPPRTFEERLWKRAFFAYAVFYLVVSSFVPAQLFPNLMFWLIAGVAGSRSLRGDAAPQVGSPTAR